MNQQNPQTEQEQHQEEQKLSELLQIRRDKLSTLKQEGKNPFETTSYERTAYAAQIVEEFEKLEGTTVSIAGRIMSKRGMGKASFIDLRDHSGRVQSYVRQDHIGDESYADFKKWDIGDIIGLEGEVFRTQKGEISVKAEKVTLLSKSLLPLPEKWHGLKDTELRYRQRYVDLIVNPDVKDVFVKRSKIISAIRTFLDQKGFLEVETPVLHPQAGGANARPFITHHNALNIDMYMRIALELHLKRLIVGGFDKVYEIGRVFRNEGIDTRHNPEFTLLELYEAYTDYHGMMDITEELFRYCAHQVLGTGQVAYGDLVIDLDKPFERISMLEAVKKYSGVDFTTVQTLDQARSLAKEHHVDYEERHAKGDILSLFFEKYCEEHLIQPTFITDHPVDISPLSKRKKDDPEYTERFELFILGREHANAFSELNDPIDQRERFERQAELKAAGDDEATDVDEDFLTALEYGLPPTGGLGIGIDRMVMLLTNAQSIRDVLLFPTMKPLDTPKDKNGVQKSEEAATVETASENTPAVNANDPSMPIFDAKKPDFASLVIEPLFEDLVDFETFSKSDFRAVKIKDCIAVPKSKKLLQFTLDDGTGTDRTILSGIHAYYEPEQLIGKTCIAITNLPPRKMMGIDSCGMLISAVHKEGEEEKLHLLMVDPSIPAGAKLY